MVREHDDREAIPGEAFTVDINADDKTTGMSSSVKSVLHKGFISWLSRYVSE
jgi:hypothetical protein